MNWFAQLLSAFKQASVWQNLAFGIQSVSVLAEHQQQAQYAAEQRRLLDEANMMNQRLLDEQLRQSNAKAAEDKHQRRIQAQREAAATRLATSESGLGGLNAARLLRSVYATSGQDIATIEANRRNKSEQIKHRKRAMNTETESKKRAYTKPSGLATIGSIASAGLQIYGKN